MKLRSNIVKKILFDSDDNPIFILENQVVYDYATNKKQRIVNLGAVKDAEYLKDNRLWWLPGVLHYLNQIKSLIPL